MPASAVTRGAVPAKSGFSGWTNQGASRASAPASSAQQRRRPAREGASCLGTLAAWAGAEVPGPQPPGVTTPNPWHPIDVTPGESLDFDLPTDTPLRRAAVLIARPLLHWTLRLNTLRKLYAQASALRASADDECNRHPVTFARFALEVLNVTPVCNMERLAGIPARGPLIVAANHPHGALDGLALLDVVGRVRPDVRLLANHLLACIPELRELCFFVDPFESRNSTQRSLAGLRAAHRWLRQGGALIVFPAGEVAHVRSNDGSLIDSPWRSTVGRLAASAAARVLPVHIEG